MRKVAGLVLAITLVMPAAYADYTPTPAPSATAAPTATPAPTATAAPTATPTPSPSPSPTATAIATAAPTATPTATATATPAPTATPSATPAPSAAAVPAATPVAPVVTVQSELARAFAMVTALDYQGARKELIAIDKVFANDANVNNLLGYTSRKLKLYDSSATYYKKALAIDPNHLGALEYQGELFVATKKIAAAKANLKKLGQICGLNCEEYLDLKKAIGKKK